MSTLQKWDVVDRSILRGKRLTSGLQSFAHSSIEQPHRQLREERSQLVNTGVSDPKAVFRGMSNKQVFLSYLKVLFFFFKCSKDIKKILTKIGKEV